MYKLNIMVYKYIFFLYHSYKCFSWFFSYNKIYYYILIYTQPCPVSYNFQFSRIFMSVSYPYPYPCLGFIASTTPPLNITLFLCFQTSLTTAIQITPQTSFTEADTLHNLNWKKFSSGMLWNVLCTPNHT